MSAKCNYDTDELVPDWKVWREFGISSMSGYRWTNDRSLDFPPPIKIEPGVSVVGVLWRSSKNAWCATLSHNARRSGATDREKSEREKISG